MNTYTLAENLTVEIIARWTTGDGRQAAEWYADPAQVRDRFFDSPDAYDVDLLVAIATAGGWDATPAPTDEGDYDVWRDEVDAHAAQALMTLAGIAAWLADDARDVQVAWLRDGLPEWTPIPMLARMERAGVVRRVGETA